jgi:poly-gamma-glutamate synthesis protein (capsule biosynthesis protein)
MRIIIGADLVPTESNKELFNNADIDTLVGSDLNKVLLEADFRIFNLEVPLTNTEAPIAKCGPNLISPPSTIEGIKSIGVDFLTLANNHILDQGEQGLYSTIDILSKNNIAFAGVGSNLNEASRPYIFEIEGKKIGIYCCAEHEFTIATERAAGANPFDPLESLEHIKDLKSQADYVIVLYHGGKEHCRYPSPYLQKVCRKCVEKGADLVVCQHSHCIGCEEKYLNGTIVYGQGNFLFDHSESEYWQTSLLIKIANDFDISYIPLVKEKNAVRLADEEKSNEIMLQFKQRSSEILIDGFIEEKYSEFAKSMINNYLFKLSGKRKSFLFRAINKMSGYRYMNFYLKRRYTQSDLLAIQNYIECEAHREVLCKGIKCKEN